MNKFKAMPIKGQEYLLIKIETGNTDFQKNIPVFARVFDYNKNFTAHVL